MGKARILVIDDEESPRESLRFILKDRYEVITREDGPGALSTLSAEGPFDVVLLDMKMPGMSGLEVLGKILELAPAMPVVIVTAISEAKPAVQAMKMGAADYLNKPFDVDEIRLVVQRILKEKGLEHEVGRPRTEQQGAYNFESMVGSGAAMQKVYALIKRLLDTDTTVLIRGETGTGKELVARALHYNSARKDKPFIPVHCAAIPGELLESELFGHEKGAFTGAFRCRIGMFEAASGGTLFLDEIGEMARGTQSKLLRAIQEREIRRVGGQEIIGINVRLVCATNRNLEEECKEGRFREDLFYRINVVPIDLPPLRERQEDIPHLVAHFAEQFGKQLGRAVPQFTPGAMHAMLRYPWPGNVRELEHAIERLLVTCDALEIGVEHLPFIILQAEAASAVAAMELGAETPRPELGKKLDGSLRIGKMTGPLDLPKLTEDLERQAIEEALRQSGGVLTEAANILNITRRMLRYKMGKLGISPQNQSNVDDPVEENELPPA
jgi:DNA-binding NtrC family response regulator